MRLTLRLSSVTGFALAVALLAAACTSATTPTPAPAAATPTPTPASTSAMATAAGALLLTIGSTNDPTGGYLTGPTGMTLYVFTKDTADTSACSGSCATTWPPLTAASGATITGPDGATGTFATITRSDGAVQVTYNHMPLYYFSGDSAGGDTNGEGKSGVWFIAPLSGALASPSAAATVAPASSSGY
jgi:predicted lipoprotein with Yx(FWY)xxD motif